MTPTCEKCGKPIEGTVFRWQEGGGRLWKALCWPCKDPMMKAALPRALKQLKAELESPAHQKALAEVLFGDPSRRS